MVDVDTPSVCPEIGIYIYLRQYIVMSICSKQ